MSTAFRRLIVLGACYRPFAALTVPASAADPTGSVTFEAGLVCAFPLVREDRGEGSQVYQEFYDNDGNLRTLSAGTGFELAYAKGTRESFNTPRGALVH